MSTPIEPKGSAPNTPRAEVNIPQQESTFRATRRKGVHIDFQGEKETPKRLWLALWDICKRILDRSLVPDNTKITLGDVTEIEATGEAAIILAQRFGTARAAPDEQIEQGVRDVVQPLLAHNARDAEQKNLAEGRPASAPRVATPAEIEAIKDELAEIAKQDQESGLEFELDIKPPDTASGVDTSPE